MMLREVEKTLIKEHTEPLKHFAIHDTMKKILVTISPSSLRNTHFKRCTGGSKEKALANLSNDKLSDSDKCVLNGTACSWRGANLPTTSLEVGVQSIYCSNSYAQEGRLKRGGKIFTINDLNKFY